MSRSATEVEHPAYRPDIDGLRAIAVLAVIAYHVDPRWLPGGFIGVDIFFVISGYLITANLFRAEVARTALPGGTGWLGVSYARFLAGRIRRLAPALLLVIAATLGATQWLLRPEDAKAAAESALWSLASAANLYFWLRVDHGYFAPASAEQPLLHLWSLGVEEQFYLLWPLVLALGVMPLWRRFGAAAATVAVVLLAAAALALGHVATGTAPDFAYYALPTRAGGLLTGAVLALLLARQDSGLAADTPAGDQRVGSAASGGMTTPRTRPSWPPSPRAERALREALSWSGAILIFCSGVFWIDDAAPYPGFAVLWPTAGAALILLAGSAWGGSVRGINPPSGNPPSGNPPSGNPPSGNPPSRPHALHWLLANRPMVSIGQISYAAYLWHWPVLAFYRYGHGAPGTGAGVALVLATLMLAAASTYLVEQPLRRTRAAPGRTAITLLVAPGLALACVATFIHASDGFGVRAWSSTYVAAWQRTQGGSRSSEQDPTVCQRTRLLPEDLLAPRCLGGARDPHAPTVLLWGDSHAAHFAATLSKLGAAGGFRVRNAAHSGCPPLLDDPIGFAKPRVLEDCRASLEVVSAALPRYRDVVIAASWLSYRQRAPDFHARFENTVRTLRARGVRVALIGRIPLMPGFDRLCEEKALAYPGLACPAPRVRYQAMVEVDNAWLRELAARDPGVTYIDPTRHLCPGGICAAHDSDGTLLYHDSNHLSIAGSRVLGERILRDEGMPAAFRDVGQARHEGPRDTPDGSDR